MSEFIVRDTDRGNERPVESRAKAEEVKKELEDLGASVEIIPPGKSDGGVDIVDHAEGETTDSVESVRETRGELPDRQLTDDPIEWLQQGDGELTTSIKGTTVITKKGFRVLQHKYDISTSSDVVVGPEDTDHTFCRVKARAEMPDGRYAEAHASAHTDRGDDHFLLVSMADTRAKSRALSDITGVGAVAIEEMAGVDPE